MSSGLSVRSQCKDNRITGKYKKACLDISSENENMISDFQIRPFQKFSGRSFHVPFPVVYCKALFRAGSVSSCAY